MTAETSPGPDLVRDLVIVGAGGFAREAVEVVRAINEVSPRWQLLGLLDDDPARHGTTVAGVPVLGPVDAVAGEEHVQLVVCVGNPANYVSRARIVERLGLPLDRYATLTHPTAVVPASCSVGPGSVLHAHVVLTAEVRLGAHVAVMPQVVFTHDDVIGDHVTCGAGVRLAGGVRVDTGAYLGSGVLVREYVSIGAWSLVGMGSLVTTSIPPREVWVGSPARRLRAADIPSDLSGGGGSEFRSKPKESQP